MASNRKTPCIDCDDTGVIFSGESAHTTVCHCGATGEKKVAKAKAKPVDSQAPRFFRGAKLRNT